MLVDGFLNLVHSPVDELDPEEVNLLYVAVTRAVEVLEINTALRDVLERTEVRESA